MTSRQAVRGIGGLAALALGIGLLLWPQLPAMIPTRWDMSGNVTSLLPKGAAIALMSTITLIPAIPLRRVRADEAGVENASPRATKRYILFLVALVMLYTWVLMLSAALGHKLDIPRLLMTGVFLFLALMSNVLTRLRHMRGLSQLFAPRSAASPSVEELVVRRVAQRIAARVMFTLSVLFGILTILGQPPLPCLIAVIACPIAAEITAVIICRARGL